MKLALFILMLPVVCLGQHPLLTGSGVDWTRASSSLITPTGLIEQAPEHWWRASDLNGVTPLNYNWQDKIQTGYFWLFSQVSSSVAPTVTANSVTFGGSSTLTNANQTYVFTSQTNYKTISICIKPASGHTAQYGLMNGASISGIFWSLASKSLFCMNLNVTPTGATNNFLQDWLMTQTNLLAAANLIAFTNNVESAQAAGSGSQLALFRLGGIESASSGFFGDIYEVICFTNKPGFGGFTNPTDLANLHKYFTNTYNFSP